MSRRAWLPLALALAVGFSPAGAQAPAKHFLWKVTNQAGASAFLLGSLHVLTPDFYPLPAAIEQAFKSSKVLVEEVDLDEMNDPAAAMPIMAKSVFTDGRTLDQVIAPETFADVRARAAKAGIPINILQRMKPWMAAVVLTVPSMQAAGFDTSLGVDKHFFDEAKAAGLERRALETVSYQLDRFDELSPALQEEVLKSTLKELDTQVSSVKELAQAWATGQTATIEKLLVDSMMETPELYQRLLVERNQNWLVHIDTCLGQNDGCFIVVGAAHLVGPDGVPALLAKKGYTVTQQ